MKAKFLTAIISTSLLLTACGHDHAPKAVDKLEEAQTNALANAPTAEAVQFEDHGQPTIGGAGGASGVSTSKTDDKDDSAPAEATAESDSNAPAETPADEANADSAESTPDAETSAEK